MDLIRRYKYIFLLLSFLAFILLVLLYRSYVSPQINTSTRRSSVVNSSSTIDVASNSEFDIEEFNAELSDFIQSDTIESLKVNFTDSKDDVKSFYQESSSDGVIDYIGKVTTYNNKILALTFYINPMAVSTLDKDIDEVTFDVLQQILIEIDSLNLADRKVLDINATSDSFDQELQDTYVKTGIAAQEIIDSGNVPFVISDL